MTLLFYVHWFWITVLLNVSQCYGHVTVNTTEVPRFNESEISNRSSKAINFYSPSTFVTTNNTPSTAAPVKFKIPPKKLLLVNATRKVSDTSSHLHVKPTVIDANSTEVNTNLTENQISINASFSLAENATVETEGLNQTLLLSSEEIKEEPAPDNLSAAGITGITLGCVSIVAIVIAVSYFLYRNRGFNRPQVLNDHCSNLDSSGYIDDTSVWDNSEEMYSLDNDSFLNSLEAMTIQNYWTDTVKHTKL